MNFLYLTISRSMIKNFIVIYTLLLLLNTNNADHDTTPQTLPDGHLKRLGEHITPLSGHVQELDYMIGGKDFYQYFIRQREPIVFRGVTKNWKATKHWKNENYLLENYADVIFDVELKKVFKGDLNPRKTMNFSEFLSSYRTNTMYLDSPFPQSPLMNDLELPLMMQCEVLRESFTSMHLLFSNGNTSSPLHADGYENFLTLFSGQKVVYLTAPKYGEMLYMKEISDFPGLSPVNPEAVDLLKYPNLLDVPFHKVVLEAGDMLYIPQGWYHQVRSYQTPNIAASMWFLYYKHIVETDFSYRDQIEQEAMFKKLVDDSPETIECRHQNMEMLNFHQFNLPRIVNKPIKTKQDSKNSSFVNNTILYEEVKLDVPTIYVGSDDRYIYAIDLQTGRVKWKVETEQDTGSTCAFNGVGDMIFCGADDGYMRAIYAHNGVVKWAYKTGAQVVSSAYVDENDVIYFGSLDHSMYALFSNGSLKWRRTLQGPVWPSPIEHQNKEIIFIASHHNEMAIKNVFALEKESGKTLWKKYSSAGFMSSPKLSHDSKWVYFCDNSGVVNVFDSLDGSVVYKHRFGVDDSIMASPAVSPDNVVYILMKSGKLVALSVPLKKVLWQKELGESKMGSSSSPLLSINDILYVGGGNGTVYAIHVSDGRILWRHDIGTGIFFSSPRLTKNGMLLIGSLDGPLYALNVDDGKEVWVTKTNGPLVGTALVTRGFI